MQIAILVYDGLTALDAIGPYEILSLLPEATVGVSAGIDMALFLASQLADAQTAQAIQLAVEYDPQPPFDTGSPLKVPPTIVEVAQRLLSKRR